jgi:hypothetical protein
MDVGRLGALETAEYRESRSLIYARVIARLDRFAEKDYITKETHQSMRAYYQKRLAESHAACADIQKETGLSEAVLRVWLLGIEKRALKNLYVYGEISEQAYKRIAAKLTVRTEDAERGYSTSEIHISMKDDLFELVAQWVCGLLLRGMPLQSPKERFMYYRALLIIAHKVEKELDRIKRDHVSGMFTPEVVERAYGIYRKFQEHATRKMREIAADYEDVVRPLTEKLARRGILKVEEHLLHNLLEHEMITPKVFATLRGELENETIRNRS